MTGTMDHLEDVTRLPEDFDGRVRLFPLPELVVFPHAMQPLHIFEPRYRDLLAEALATDRLIAMATLTGGLPATSAENPPVASTVCVGRVISHAVVEGDRHNILLVGIKRARIVRELETAQTFRSAEVDVLHDVYSPAGAEARVGLKQSLLEAFGAVVPAGTNLQQNLHELMAGQMGLGPITDIMSYTLPLEVEDKLRLLTEANVDRRAGELVRLLQSGKVQLHAASADKPSPDPSSSGSSEGDGGFPPPFSVN